MKRTRNWKQEAGWYQRLVAALVHKYGPEVTITEEDFKVGVEKGVEIKQGDRAISMRVPVRHQSLIIVPK